MSNLGSEELQFKTLRFLSPNSVKNRGLRRELARTALARADPMSAPLAPLSDVDILWDFENVPIPSDVDDRVAAGAIMGVAAVFGRLRARHVFTKPANVSEGTATTLQKMGFVVDLQRNKAEEVRDWPYRFLVFGRASLVAPALRVSSLGFVSGIAPKCYPGKGRAGGFSDDFAAIRRGIVRPSDLRTRVIVCGGVCVCYPGAN